jgi:hypothetical protein
MIARHLYVRPVTALTFRSEDTLAVPALLLQKEAPNAQARKTPQQDNERSQARCATSQSIQRDRQKNSARTPIDSGCVFWELASEQARLPGRELRLSRLGYVARDIAGSTDSGVLHRPTESAPFVRSWSFTVRDDSL